MAEEKSPIEHYAGLVRYHRAMAIAAAGDDESCAHHTAKMNAALAELRKLAIDTVEAR